MPRYLISKYYSHSPLLPSLLKSPSSSLVKTNLELRGKKRGRYLDPMFALFIGVSAAGVRIRREETVLGRSAWETAVRWVAPF